MFYQVQTWRAIRAMCTDSSLKEGHVYNHASNYLAVDYLVNKPLPAAGISADNVRGWEMSEKWTFGREAKLLWQMWNSEDNLSAKDIISRYTSKPERGLFIL